MREYKGFLSYGCYFVCMCDTPNKTGNKMLWCLTFYGFNSNFGTMGFNFICIFQYTKCRGVMLMLNQMKKENIISDTIESSSASRTVKQGRHVM